MTTAPVSFRVIGLSGGIGAGKSVVGRLLRLMGVALYDCDREASALVDSSPAILADIAAAFGADMVEQGRVHRKRLAAAVFGNKENLARLNAIVHPRVREHLRGWIEARCREGRAAVAFETAILREARLEEMATEVWWVTAPEEMRMERVMARNGLAREQVEERMRSQNAEPPQGARIIINDGLAPLIPQIEALL